MQKIKFIFLLAALLISSNVYSQSKMVFHLVGGYDLPAADLGGSYTGSPFIPEHYYMNPGPNVGADFKFYVDKNRTIGITAAGSYNFFKTDNLGGYYNELGNTYYYSDKLNILSASLGAEYRFITSSKFKPFIGLDLSGYFYDGKRTPSISEYPEIKVKSTRFGFALGTGVDWTLSKYFGLVLGAKYNFANLIGKNDSTETSEKNTTGLLDKKSRITLFSDVYFPAREIQYLQFYVGVSFFIMPAKKK